MLDLVDLAGEGDLSAAVLQTGLAQVDACSKCGGVLSVEEEREARHQLDLVRAANLHLESLGGVVVADDLNGLPRVFVLGETGRDGVGLVRTHFTVAQPLLDRAVLIPSVVACESLLGWSA